jgi:hypothetical protein
MARVRLALAGLLVAAATAAAAQSGDVPIDRYREAAGFRELGTVGGHAFHERRKPSAADLPLAGTAVMLFPRSEAWLFRLQAIKRSARDSVDAYREAANLVRASREAYEKSLLEAGVGDLQQAAVAGAEGLFTLEGIPAGPWILFAYHSNYVNKATRTPIPGSTPPRPGGRPFPFLVPDKLAGYYVVTYWLRELIVAGGSVEAVELTDRNVWFTGVSESRQPPPLPNQPRLAPR